MGHAGCDDLPPTGPAGHEVRLDEACRDLEVGLHEASVEADDGAARRATEIDMRRVVGGHVVLDRDRVHHPGIADQLLQLRALVRAVEAGGDDDADALARNARVEQHLDQRPEE